MLRIERTPEWEAAEAEYRSFIDRVKADPHGIGGRNMLRAIEIFEAYPHDYDLSKSPLSGLSDVEVSKIFPPETQR